MCTLGPATSSEGKIQELVHAGMDVARLNMSHGTHEQHAEAYRQVRAASDASGHGVGILADLQGPKIRLETFRDGPVKLKRGQQWTITTRDVDGNAEISGTTYKGLPGDVAPGDPILIDDGKVRLRVTAVFDQTPGREGTARPLSLSGVVEPSITDRACSPPRGSATPRPSSTRSWRARSRKIWRLKRRMRPRWC